MSFVLDASVAVPWFLPPTEPGWSECREVLDSVQRLPRDYMVPEHFYFEVFSALCRRLPDEQEVMGAMDRLMALVSSRAVFEPLLGREAARIAFGHKLRGYDACYVALAKLTGSIWLTADRTAHERVAALGLSRLVGT